MPKEKLTLSVDEEVVRKAKKLGINISEITEKVLRSFTFSSKGADESLLRSKYRELFDTMAPLLKNYGASVEVGYHNLTKPEEGAEGVEWLIKVELCPDGGLYSSDIEAEVPIEMIELHEFDPPQKILSRFMDAISSGSERMKESLKELEMAKRIVEAIAGNVGKAKMRKR